jgi:hypothetical protein
MFEQEIYSGDIRNTSDIPQKMEIYHVKSGKPHIYSTDIFGKLIEGKRIL